MIDYLQQLVDFTASHPSIVGLIILFSAAAEAVVIVGTLFPGTTIVLALASAAGAAHADVWLLAFWAAMGAIIGDGVSYWIGHRYGDRLSGVWPFRHRPYLLDRGAAYFELHGGKSVFFARFLPVVRAVVPVAAGMLGMPVARFFVANVTSAAVWAISHVLPAAGVGLAFVTLGNISGRLALLAGLALIITVFVIVLVRLTIRRVAPVAVTAYEGAIAYLSAQPSPFFRRLAQFLDPTQPRIAPVALWSTILALASIGFLILLEDLVTGDLLVRADTAINHLVQSLRTPLGDSIMAVTTSLGDTTVIGGLILLVTGWLVWRRAFVTTGALILTIGVSAAFVFVMKMVLHKPRPLNIYSGTDAFSFPSGHATLTVVLFGIIAFLVSKNLARPAQIIVFTTAGLIAGAIGLSRIYLSAHWPSDVIGGFLFGTAMIAFFALIFENLPAEKIGRAGLATLAMTSFISLGTWHASNAYEKNVVRYARQTTELSLSRATWANGAWQKLPSHRIDVAGELEEPIVLQWAGTAASLAIILTSAGWFTAPEWSAGKTLQLFNPSVALKSLPPLPLLNDGYFPTLTMIRAEFPESKQRLVFRGWQTQTVVVDGNQKTPVLVGSITTEVLSHPFGLIGAIRDRSPPNSAISTFVSAVRTDNSTVTILPTGGVLEISPILASPVGSP